MKSIYLLKLGLKVYHINIRTEKIDGLIIEIFEIILSSFQLKDKFKKVWFF